MSGHLQTSPPEVQQRFDALLSRPSRATERGSRHPNQVSAAWMSDVAHTASVMRRLVGVFLVLYARAIAPPIRLKLKGNNVPVELLGWASSAILILTLMRQVYTQWKTQATAGVSKWLFIGQLAASTGYLIYSFLLHNWVFLSSNVAILCTALLGDAIYLRNRRLKAGRDDQKGGSAARA